MSDISLKRIAYLIRNEWMVKWRIYTALLVFAVLFSFVNFLVGGDLLSSILTSIVGSRTIPNAPQLIDISNHKYHYEWFPSFFVFTISVITSLAFWEYRKGATSNFHISLPAMTIEKWIAKLIFVLILSPLAILLIYQVYENITHALALSDGTRLVRLKMWDPYVWTLIPECIAIQAVVFAGAVLFRAHSTIKIAITAMALWLIKNIVTNILVSNHLDSDLSFAALLSSGPTFRTQFSPSSYYFTSITSAPNSTPSYYIIACILFVIASIAFSYYRFKEIEA